MRFGTGVIPAAIVVGTLVGVLRSQYAIPARTGTEGSLSSIEIDSPQKLESQPELPQIIEPQTSQPERPSLTDEEWEEAMEPIRDAHERNSHQFVLRTQKNKELMAGWWEICEQWRGEYAHLTSIDRAKIAETSVYDLQAQWHAHHEALSSMLEALEELLVADTKPRERRDRLTEAQRLAEQSDAQCKHFCRASANVASAISEESFEWASIVDAEARRLSAAQAEKTRQSARTELVNYARRLDQHVSKSCRRMQSCRETVSMYRSFTAHYVHGKLRAIENLSYKSDHLCERLSAEANVIRRKENPTPEWWAFESKKVKNLLNEIQDVTRTVEHETDNIRMTPKPITYQL